MSRGQYNLEQIVLEEIKGEIQRNLVREKSIPLLEAGELSPAVIRYKYADVLNSGK